MARIARTSCLVAGLALMLAGCATAPPPPVGVPPAACDLICRMLRLFDLDTPAPVPAASASAPPASSVPPSGEHRAGRRSETAHAILTRPEVVPLRSSDEPAVVLPAAAGETSIQPQTAILDRPSAAPPPEEIGLRRTLAGSPPIAPPWFEPWPAH